MRYSDKSANANTVADIQELIANENSFAQANKRNSCESYNHDKVLEFLSSDSERFSKIVERLFTPKKSSVP